MRVISAKLYLGANSTLISLPLIYWDFLSFPILFTCWRIPAGNVLNLCPDPFPPQLGGLQSLESICKYIHIYCTLQVHIFCHFIYDKGICSLLGTHISKGSLSKSKIMKFLYPLLLSFNFRNRSMHVCLVVSLLQKRFRSLFWHPTTTVTYTFIWVVVHVHCMMDDLNFCCWLCNLEL